MRPCPQCGSLMEFDDKFCSQCGTLLQKDAESENTKPDLEPVSLENRYLEPEQKDIRTEAPPTEALEDMILFDDLDADPIEKSQESSDSDNIEAVVFTDPESLSLGSRFSMPESTETPTEALDETVQLDEQETIEDLPLSQEDEASESVMVESNEPISFTSEALPLGARFKVVEELEIIAEPALERSLDETVQLMTQEETHVEMESDVLEGSERSEPSESAFSKEETRSLGERFAVSEGGSDFVEAPPTEVLEDAFLFEDGMVYPEDRLSSVVDETVLLNTNESVPQDFKDPIPPELPVSKAQVQSQKPDKKSAKPPKSMVSAGKKNLKFVFIGIIVCVVVVSVYFAGAYFNSRSYAAASFAEAVSKRDVPKVLSYLTCSDPELVLNEDSVEPLLDYAEQHPEWLKSLTQQDGLKTDDLVLVKKGKQWLVYDKYVFEAAPYYIDLKTAYKDTQILINGTVITTSDKEKFSVKTGPYIMGVYTIRTVQKTEGSKLENTIALEIVNGTKDELGRKLGTAEVGIEGKRIQINSNVLDATVYVDGRNTGIKVKDAGQYGLVGPQTAIHAEMELPWGTMASNKVSVGDLETIDLHFVPDEATKKSLMDAAHQYNVTFFKALNANDISKLEQANDEVKAAVKKQLDNLTLANTSFKGQYKKTVFDMDAMKVEWRRDRYCIRMLLKEEYSVGYGTAATPNPQLKAGIQQLDYGLTYDLSSKKWVVSFIKPSVEPFSGNHQELQAQ